MVARAILGILVFLVISSFSETSYGQSSTTGPGQVATELESLDRWLGPGANGDAWRDYLRLDDLRAQLQQEGAVDRQVVGDVLWHFESGAPGLEHARFVRFRQALQRWLQQLPRPRPSDLPQVVLSAKDHFHPVAKEELEAARKRLEQAVARLDRYLGQGRNGQNWRAYLNWEQLQGVLAAEGEPPAESIQQVMLRFESGRPGLERPVFAAVGQALQEYQSKALVNLNEEVEYETTRSLEFLSQKLGEYFEKPSQQAAHEIGQVLGWLEERNQAPQVVADVRSHFTYPNLYIQASERLVSASMHRTVNRVEPITDVILGTQIRGMGNTVGFVTAQFVPSRHYAIVDSLFNGTTYSRTVGRNGPATIHSAGTTRFQARKRIYIDEEGIKTVPATAGARTQTRTLSVDSGRGGILIGHIADRIAARRVAENKARSEQISSQRAEVRIRNRVEREGNPRLAEAHQDYQRDWLWPLKEEGVFPRSMNFSTSDNYLYGTGVEANEYQLAAPTAPLPLRVRSDLALRLHESAINNMAEGYVAGEEVEEREFQDWVRQRLGRLPKELESDPEKAPWTITFAEQRPITVNFHDNQVTVTLRVRRVEGTVSSRRSWEITANYQLYKIPGGVRAVRQGSIEVLPPGYMDEGLSGSAAAERGSIQRQFEQDLFRETMEHNGLKPTGNLAKLGTLPLVEVVTAYGWATLGWIKP